MQRFALPFLLPFLALIFMTRCSTGQPPLIDPGSLASATKTNDGFVGLTYFLCAYKNLEESSVSLTLTNLATQKKTVLTITSKTLTELAKGIDFNRVASNRRRHECERFDKHGGQPYMVSVPALFALPEGRYQFTEAKVDIPSISANANQYRAYQTKLDLKGFPSEFSLTKGKWLHLANVAISLSFETTREGLRYYVNDDVILNQPYPDLWAKFAPLLGTLSGSYLQRDTELGFKAPPQSVPFTFSSDLL